MITRKLKPRAGSSMLNVEDSLVYLRKVVIFSQPSNKEFVHSSHPRDNSYTLYTIHRSFCQVQMHWKYADKRIHCCNMERQPVTTGLLLPVAQV